MKGWREKKKRLTAAGISAECRYFGFNFRALKAQRSCPCPHFFKIPGMKSISKPQLLAEAYTIMDPGLRTSVVRRRLE